MQIRTNPTTGESIALRDDAWVPYTKPAPAAAPEGSATIHRQGLATPANGGLSPAAVPAGQGMVQRFVTDPVRRGVATTQQAAGALGALSGGLSFL